MADEDISPYISWPGKTQCPWILFHANALTLLDTLYGETCSPQAKINKFITAAKCRFARSPTRGKKSKKQASKLIHIPGVSSYKQKDTVTNRQSCQPAPTSCRDRSLTPHPFGRGKADTREEWQLTSNSHRAMSPTPHQRRRSPTPPRRCRNANTRTFSQSIDPSFHIDTIPLLPPCRNNKNDFVVLFFLYFLSLTWCLHIKQVQCLCLGCTCSDGQAVCDD